MSTTTGIFCSCADDRISESTAMPSGPEPKSRSRSSRSGRCDRARSIVSAASRASSTIHSWLSAVIRTTARSASESSAMSTRTVPGSSWAERPFIPRSANARLYPRPIRRFNRPEVTFGANRHHLAVSSAPAPLGRTSHFRSCGPASRTVSSNRLQQAVMSERLLERVRRGRPCGSHRDAGHALHRCAHRLVSFPYPLASPVRRFRAPEPVVERDVDILRG